MWLTIIHAKASVASFRIPEAHTFQKTLPLPPYTTLIGLLGAALRLSFEEACRWVEEHAIQMGVAGTHQGDFKDLWKIQKIKNKKMESSILLKEYLYDVSLQIVYGSSSQEDAETILQAFLDPGYALTAGNSDSLLYIDRSKSSVQEVEFQEIDEAEHTVFFGDISQNYRPHQSILNLPIVQTLQSPLIYHLPTKFSFNNQKRSVVRREFFSFIGHRIIFSKPQKGYLIDDQAFFLR